jgi:hypothetical protein
VTKTLIDNGSFLNLIMRHTYLEIKVPLCLHYSRSTRHFTAIPLDKIDLMIYGVENNMRRETLTFKVADFNLGYNYILGRPFLIKFMAVYIQRMPS